MSDEPDKRVKDALKRTDDFIDRTERMLDEMKRDDERWRCLDLRDTNDVSDKN